MSVHDHRAPAARYPTGLGVLAEHLLGDLQRHGVVVAAGDEEQRATVGQLGVDLGRD